MKAAFIEQCSDASLITGRRQPGSIIDFFFQAPVAFRHQNKKNRVGHAEERTKGNVRQAALRPVKERSSRVSQLVKRADEDQIRIAPQIAARNQKISHADHQHEHAQQREITAKYRQFVTNTQRGKRAGGEKGEREAQNRVVDGGEIEKAAIILFSGGIHIISL